jgi:hypothetical protein
MALISSAQDAIVVLLIYYKTGDRNVVRKRVALRVFSAFQEIAG